MARLKTPFFCEVIDDGQPVEIKGRKTDSLSRDDTFLSISIIQQQTNPESDHDAGSAISIIDEVYWESVPMTIDIPAGRPSSLNNVLSLDGIGNHYATVIFKSLDCIS